MTIKSKNEWKLANVAIYYNDKEVFLQQQSLRNLKMLKDKTIVRISEIISVDEAIKLLESKGYEVIVEDDE